MWFKNLLVYRLTQALEADPAALEASLGTKKARKPGSQELSTIGFIAPHSKEPDAPLLHQVNGVYLVALRGYERILPGSVVKDALDEKVEEIELAQGVKVYKKQKDQLKDEIIQALLPHAFIKKTTTYAAIDAKNSIIYVNATSASTAEALLSTLREVIGSLPVRPISVKISPTATFTDWVRNAKAESGFYLLNDCELQDTNEDGGSIAVKNQDLSMDEIKNLLLSGKQVTQLSLAWKDKCSFVVDSKLHIKRLRFDDLIQDQAAKDGGEDAAGQFDASFLLMTSTLAELMPEVLTALGGEDLPQAI